jgi:hypothetical protein
MYVPEHYVRHCLAIDAQLDRLTGTRDRRPEAARRADVIGRLSVDPSLYERLHSRLTDGQQHKTPHEVARQRQDAMEAEEQARRAKDERYDRWMNGENNRDMYAGVMAHEQRHDRSLGVRDAFHRVKNNLRDDANHYRRIFDEIERRAAEAEAEDAAPAPARSRYGRPDAPRDRGWDY